MWLDEIEAMYEIDKFPSRGTTGHIARMARVLRELARYTGDFAIEMGGMHIFKDTYKEDLSDDAWNLLLWIISPI